jgi:hypothetical protein
MSDAKELSKEKKTYLQDWLNKAGPINEAVPKVKQQLELAIWEEKAFSEMPDRIANAIPANVTKHQKQDIMTLHKTLPSLPEIKNNLVCISDATAATTSNMIFQIIDDARHNQEQQIHEWGERHSTQYIQLQERLGREKEVRKYLLKIKGELATEFDKAISAYRREMAGIESKSEFGITMRNVLEHYKGEIMNQARQQPKEQKIEWHIMAERLVKNIMDSRQRFIEQGERWKNLHERLTKLAKGLIKFDQHDLESIFTESLEHMYIVLSLVNA